MLDLISNDSAPSTLPIAQIRKDGDTQPRGGLDEERVKQYERNIEAGDNLPAIDVTFDGSDYWLWDGFHRIEAHTRRGLTEIAVRVQRGTLDDAQWNSYGANKDHGLNRTTEDKARAVRRALRHPNGAGRSNVQIAKHVGVDDKTVAKYRAEMETASEIPRVTQRAGSDGKRYDTSAISSARKTPSPYAPNRIATFKADPADPDSADVHLMEFAHVLPTKPQSSPTPAVTPSPSLPADLAAQGWVLRQAGGVGRYYGFDKESHRATGLHERAEDAVAEIWGMSGVSPPKPPAAGPTDKERASVLVALYRQVLDSLPEFRRLVRASGKVDSVEQYLGEMAGELERKYA